METKFALCGYCVDQHNTALFVQFSCFGLKQFRQQQFACAVPSDNMENATWLTRNAVSHHLL